MHNSKSFNLTWQHITSIGLANKLTWDFPKLKWKNPSELFGYTHPPPPKFESHFVSLSLKRVICSYCC